jgi:ketosteroid isomerase-like protein
MSGDEAAVLKVNLAFYAAFRTRDMAAMDRLWARRAPVACIHPGWQALRGREAVMGSWAQILEGPNPPAITCHRATAHLLGDTAFVICNERVTGDELVATNVFVREDGDWRLVQHHAGGVAQPSDEGPSPGGTVH